MQEQIIQFETAKLARQKGLNINCLNHYFGCGQIAQSQPGFLYAAEFLYDTEFLAPTQSLLQKWLRDEFHILVEIIFDTVSFGYRIFNPYKNENYFTNPIWKTWNYEEALEAGLYDALNLIKQ